VLDLDDRAVADLILAYGPDEVLVAAMEEYLSALVPQPDETARRISRRRSASARLRRTSRTRPPASAPPRPRTARPTARSTAASTRI